MDKYYTANIFLIVIAMAIMMAAVNFNVVLDRMRKRVTIALFGAIIVAALCEWTGSQDGGAFSHPLYRDPLRAEPEQ